MTDVSATSAERASHDAAMRAVVSLENQRLALATATKNAFAKMKEINAAPNPHLASIEKLDAQIIANQEKRAALCIENGEAMALHAVAESCVKVFAPAGVRGEILDEVTPYLNSRTAKYLGTLSDGNISAVWTTITKNAKGEAKEKFGIEVDHAEGGEDFKSISGGEQRKVQIAAALALQDLVATRATKPIDLFIGDEIDNALDAAGLERLTSLLEEKARERGTVLIISHSDLRDWVSQTILVRKSGKNSTIEEITT